MAEPVELEIRVDDGRAVQGLRRVEGALQGVGSGATGAGASSANLSQKLTAGVLVYQQVAAAVSQMTDALKAAGEEFERQAGIINRFTGDISKARTRLNGLVSDLDLMLASNKAAAAGLQLTADEFATITVAANEYASATGGDAVSAINQLTQALATGRTGALRQYGIDLEGVTSVADKQRVAIDELTRQYGHAESSADTLGGQIAVMNTAMENMTTAFITGANAVTPLTDAFDELGAAVDGVADSMGVRLPTAIELVTVTGATFAATIAEGVRGIADIVNGVGSIAEAAQLLASGSWQEAMSAAFDAKAQIDQGVSRIMDAGRLSSGRVAADVAAAMEGGQTGRNAPIGGAGRGGGAGAGPERARRGRGGGGSQRDPDAELEALMGGGGTMGGSLSGIGADTLGMLGEQDAERAREAEREHAKEIASLQGQAAYEESQALERREARLDAMRKEEETQKRLLDQQAEQEAAIQREMQAREAVFGLIDQGLAGTLDLFNAGQGEKEIVMGLSQVAQAAGAYPDPVGIAQHALSAGLHFANAAKLGVGGGGSAPTGTPPPPQNVPPAGFGGGGGEGAGGGTIVNNWNTPVPEPLMGRYQRRWERAYANRFGA